MKHWWSWSKPGCSPHIHTSYFSFQITFSLLDKHMIWSMLFITILLAKISCSCDNRKKGAMLLGWVNWMWVGCSFKKNPNFHFIKGILVFFFIYIGCSLKWSGAGRICLIFKIMVTSAKLMTKLIENK